MAGNKEAATNTFIRTGFGNTVKFSTSNISLLPCPSYNPQRRAITRHFKFQSLDYTIASRALAPSVHINTILNHNDILLRN